MWNGTMFVDLDWPLNASSLLSASAELLVLLGARPNGRKSRPKAENGGGVPGEGKQASSPPGGLGSAVSSPSGVQGGAPTAQRFPLFSALRMASSDTIILL